MLFMVTFAFVKFTKEASSPIWWNSQRPLHQLMPVGSFRVESNQLHQFPTLRKAKGWWWYATGRWLIDLVSMNLAERHLWMCLQQSFFLLSINNILASKFSYLACLLIWGPHCPLWTFLIIYLLRKHWRILVIPHYVTSYIEFHHLRRDERLTFSVFSYLLN